MFLVGAGHRLSGLQGRCSQPSGAFPSLRSGGFLLKPTNQSSANSLHPPRIRGVLVVFRVSWFVGGLSPRVAPRVWGRFGLQAFPNVRPAVPLDASRDFAEWPEPVRGNQGTCLEPNRGGPGLVGSVPFVEGTVFGLVSREPTGNWCHFVASTLREACLLVVLVGMVGGLQICRESWGARLFLWSPPKLVEQRVDEL